MCKNWIYFGGRDLFRTALGVACRPIWLWLQDSDPAGSKGLELI